MDYLINNPAQSLIMAGLLMLTVEAVVMGFSTFILLFCGLSLVFTGGLVWFECIEAAAYEIILANAVSIVVISVLLWRPLKSFQDKVESAHVGNDMVGCCFLLDSDLSDTGVGCQKYSGVSWGIKADSVIPAGGQVEIVSVEVGILNVRAV